MTTKSSIRKLAVAVVAPVVAATATAAASKLLCFHPNLALINPPSDAISAFPITCGLTSAITLINHRTVHSASSTRNTGVISYRGK